MTIKDRKLSKAEIETKTGIRLPEVSRRKMEGYVQRISLPWVQKAARLPGKSLHVAIIVWSRWHLEKVPEIVLTKSKLDSFNVKRHTAARALKHLESAGLVAVKRAPGRCPRVSVIGAPKQRVKTGND